MKKRLYSKRHIKILALQRTLRILSLLNREDIYIPKDMDYGQPYPYRVELELEVVYLQQEMRNRIRKLARKEFPDIDPDIVAEIF